MSAVPFTSGARRAAHRGIAVAVVGLAAVAAVGVARAVHWSPFAGIHAPHVHVHVPPVNRTVRGPSTSTLILEHLQAVGKLHAEDATYTWSQTTSARHTTLWGAVTTGTSRHTVNLEAKVPIAVDVAHVAFAVPADRQLVLYLPPPVPGAPTIDPATQQQMDSCTTRGQWVFIATPRPCPANALAYQQEAIDVIGRQAAGDTATLDAARAQAASLIACLVSPTGWVVEVSWTDRPDPVVFTPAPCATPPAQRLSPITPPTTVAAP